MTLIDLCCVLDSMFHQGAFVSRTKTTHTLQQLRTRFSMQADHPDHQILGQTAVRIKAASMCKGNLVSVFWRLRHPTGARTEPFVRANFVVETPRKKGVHLDPANDDYVWLIPENSNTEAEPFPQDGLHGCDTYEYSYVDVTGEPEPEPVPEPVVKKTARTRPAVAKDDVEDQSSSTSAPSVIIPVRADTRFIAEDPSQWAEVLHTGDTALNVVNLRGMESYYKTTFGHLGVDASQKEMVALVIQTLSEDMEAVMADVSFARSEHWVKARCRSIHKLSMLRNAKVGYPKELLKTMDRAYDEIAIPEWQRAIHSEACQQVKITSWKPDARTAPSYGTDPASDSGDREPKGPNGGAKGKPYNGHADPRAQSTADKKASADKKAAAAAFLASVKGKLSAADFAKFKDFC